MDCFTAIEIHILSLTVKNATKATSLSSYQDDAALLASFLRLMLAPSTLHHQGSYY